MSQARYEIGENLVIVENEDGQGDGLIRNTATGAEIKLGDFVDVAGAIGSESDPVSEGFFESVETEEADIEERNLTLGQNTSTNRDNTTVLGGDAEYDAVDAPNSSEIDAVVIGTDAFSDTGQSVTIGHGAESRWTDENEGDSTIAIGENASALGHSNIAIGKRASSGSTTADAVRGVAVGRGANCEGRHSIHIGYGADDDVEGATAGSAIAIGQATATSPHSIAVGEGAVSNDNLSIAIGQGAAADKDGGNRALAIGGGTDAEDFSVAIGANAEATARGVAIGRGAEADGDVRLYQDSSEVVRFTTGGGRYVGLSAGETHRPTRYIGDDESNNSGFDTQTTLDLEDDGEFETIYSFENITQGATITATYRRTDGAGRRTDTLTVDVVAGVSVLDSVTRNTPPGTSYQMDSTDLQVSIDTVPANVTVSVLRAGVSSS